MRTILIGFLCALPAFVLFGCYGSAMDKPFEAEQTITSVTMPPEGDTTKKPVETQPFSNPDHEKTVAFFKTEISQKNQTKTPPSLFENGGDFGECKTDYNPGFSSPDEEWYVCQSPYDIYLKNLDGKEIPFDPPGITIDDKVYWFSPIRWSGDSRFIWIGAGVTGGFAEYCDPVQSYKGLFRIDLSTGKTSATLPLNKQGYFIQFSPSGRNLGFIQDRSTLTLLDLISGKKSVYQEDQELSGAMIFSPDESYLAFSAQETGSDVNCKNAVLKIMDMASGEVDTYYSDPMNAPITFSYWDEPNLVGFNIHPDQSAVLDLASKIVTIDQP